MYYDERATAEMENSDLERTGMLAMLRALEVTAGNRLGK